MRAVTNNEHTPLTGVDAAGRSVGYTIDKTGRIAWLEWDFDGGGDLVEWIGAIFEDWMRHIGLVAPRYDHRWPIAIPHVGQRQQDVDLAAAELPIMVAELGAYAALACTWVNSRGFALNTNISEGLIDEQAVVATDEVVDVCKPRRMVYQAFEGFTDFENIVQMEGISSVGVAIDPSSPGVRFKVEVGVKQGIEFSNVSTVDCILQVDIAAEVKEVLF